MTFRIKHIEGLGYYAQVKRGDTWYKIFKSYLSAKGEVCYGHTQIEDLGSPCTKEEALNLCKEFKRYQELIASATYEEFEL